MEVAPVVSLVSACTALVASIIGPVITLTVARRQFNATVISTNREKWIETLRDSLAELIALIRAALVLENLIEPGDSCVSGAMLDIDRHITVLDEDPLDVAAVEDQLPRLEIGLTRHVVAGVRKCL